MPAVIKGARRLGRGKGYGWTPDLPDHRDYLYGALRKPPTKLPPSVDLRSHCPPVVDQGQLGSCTGNSLAGAVAFLEIKDGVKFNPVSRLFIYYNERVIEHTVKQDAGAMIRDGIKSLSKQGVCSEKTWPYTISKFATKPTSGAYTEASGHKILSYARITSLTDMQACLAEGYPFVFGFTVYESFESMKVSKTGVVPMPGASERVVGGHAVVAVGYNNSQSRFIVRNSWGTGWGMKGYFTIPYQYLDNSNLADDFWTIRSEKGF